MKEVEDRAVSALCGQFGLEYSAERLKLDSWGHTDRVIVVNPGAFVVVEVEASQNHPCTNVLKLWPYLEANPSTRVLLAHIFLQGSSNRTSSRGNLAGWLAERMERELAPRFLYRRLEMSESGRLASLRGDFERGLDLMAERRSGPEDGLS